MDTNRKAPSTALNMDQFNVKKSTFAFLILTVRITAFNLETIVRHELLEGVCINGHFPCCSYFSDGYWEVVDP